MTRRTIKVIVGILVVVIIFGVIAALFSRPEKTTKEVSNFSFSVGGIDAEGKYEKRNDAIYTKDRISALDLTVTPNYTFKGKYQIFFYDGDDKFITSTEKLDELYHIDNTFGWQPECAYFYARIMILPELKDGDKINFLEPVRYSSQLKIENSNTGFKTTGDLGDTTTHVTFDPEIDEVTYKDHVKLTVMDIQDKYDRIVVVYNGYTRDDYSNGKHHFPYYTFIEDDGSTAVISPSNFAGVPGFGIDSVPVEEIKNGYSIVIPTAERDNWRIYGVTIND